MSDPATVKQASAMLLVVTLLWATSFPCTRALKTGRDWPDGPPCTDIKTGKRRPSAATLGR